MKRLIVVLVLCFFALCGCGDHNVASWPEAEGYTGKDMLALADAIIRIWPGPAGIVDVRVGEDDVQVVVNMDLIEEKSLDTQAERDDFLLQIEYEINISLQKYSRSKLPECFVSRRVPISLEFGPPSQPS